MSLFYGTLKPSSNLNSFGNAYYDAFSFNFNEFNPKKKVSYYALTALDLQRFDLFIFKVYGSSLYEKFILIANSIYDIHALPVGHVIALYETEDMDEFIKMNSRVIT